MSSPLQPEKKDRSENIGPDGSIYELPKVMLLSEKQWLYIQRRYRMSPRELQVAKLVCGGLTNGNMAEKLKVKPGTVKTHLRSIFGKTHAKNKISMLLRFIDDVNKFFGESVGTAFIPIVDTEKPTQKTSSADQILRKE